MQLWKLQMLKVIIAITEGIPVADMIKANSYVKRNAINRSKLSRIITPGEAKVGIMPGFVFKKGTVCF
jgi:succinyl-CoA synthetase alpha subunit